MMIPFISNEVAGQLEAVELPTATYRETDERIAGIIDNRPALIQSIEHILSTERAAFPIYDNDFGVEFEQYKGTEFEFIEATAENTVREALMQDDRVLDVQLISVNRSSANGVEIMLRVFDNQGEFEFRSFINV